VSEVKEKKLSPYTLLNRWLFDGSKSTKIPEDIEKDKSISHMYLLYFFRPSSYGLIISKLFNNWNLFSLDRIEVFYFLKECVMMSGYKPPFVQKIPAKKSKLVDILQEKYPFLKNEELFMLVENIDKSDEKDSVYEMFGLYSPTKKKLTKSQQDQFKQEVKKESISLDNLMENFQ